MGLGAGSGTTAEIPAPSVCGDGVTKNCCYSWEFDEGDDKTECCNFDPKFPNSGGYSEKDCCDAEGGLWYDGKCLTGAACPTPSCLTPPPGLTYL